MSLFQKYIDHSSFTCYASMMTFLRNTYGADCTVHGTSVNDGRRECGKCYAEAGGFRYVPFAAFAP